MASQKKREQVVALKMSTMKNCEVIKQLNVCRKTYLMCGKSFKTTATIIHRMKPFYWFRGWGSLKLSKQGEETKKHEDGGKRYGYFRWIAREDCEIQRRQVATLKSLQAKNGLEGLENNILEVMQHTADIWSDEFFIL